MTKDGNPTGFHKELKREVITVLGILDNKDEYDKAKADILQLVKDSNSFYYVLYGENYFQIFQSTIVTPTFKDLGDAFMNVISKVGWVQSIKNYYTDKNKLSYIEYEVYLKESNKTVVLKLESYDDKIITAGR